jgi:alpha-amylase
MTKQPKPFIFCAHAHQPVGNFEHVFEEAYTKCYKPFTDVLAKHPRCRVVMHFSGSLLDWLRQNQPQFLVTLKNLQDQGTLEILGGAYYEPVFGEIPVQDLLNQIKLMQAAQLTLFGRVSKGVWLTERVWKPELLPILVGSGIEYTILDDCHLERAGHTEPSGFYRLEEGAGALDLFTSSKKLRYLIPFSQVDDAVSFIRSAPSSEGVVTVFADDCEKFGLWPKTSAWVYGQQWLDKFLTSIEKSEDIEMMTFAEARERLEAKPVEHIPQGSYEEMTDWAGGSFDNFGEKYPESRYMKERMLATSTALAQFEGDQNGHTQAVLGAQRSLYKAQCNCSYWHGVFGGLYLHHLRSAIFENLIEADEAVFGLNSKTKDEAVSGFHKIHLPSGSRWKSRQKQILSYWNASCGAALEELDYLPRSVNLICTLKRQSEPYHEVVTKNGSSRLKSGFSIHQLLGVRERGLEKALVYDSHRRLSFMDHFFERPISVKEYESLDHREVGDFMGAEYSSHAQGNIVRFERQGQVMGHAVAISKEVEVVGDGTLKVAYQITNKESKPLKATWAVEFNFSIGNDNGPRVWDKEAVKEVGLVDSWRDIPIKLSSQGEFRVLSCPIDTVSGSEAGLGRTYQGNSLLWQKVLTLEAGQSAQDVFHLQVGDV